jgi:hypothetical protein
MKRETEGGKSAEMRGHIRAGEAGTIRLGPNAVAAHDVVALNHRRNAD